MAEKGFTLIELIVAMAVASILIAVGVPSFQSMIQNGRQSAAYNGLMSELSYARSEAVKRSTSVVVCARATDTSCGSSASWNDGWLVFVDQDMDGLTPGTDDILRISSQLHDEQTVTSSDFDNDSFVRYMARGNTGSVGNFVICDERGSEYAKAINIVLTGAIRKAVDSDNNNIVEDMSGTDVSCPS